MKKLRVIVFRCLIGSLAVVCVGSVQPTHAASIASAAMITATLSPDLISIVGTADAQKLSVIAENFGGAAVVTVSADPTDLALPVAVSICQLGTNGACAGPSAHSVTSAMDSNRTLMFTVVVQASGSIPLDQLRNRIIVRFRDENGVLVGSASAAVTNSPALRSDQMLGVIERPSGFDSGKLWQVGPTRQYKKPSDVAALVGNGDTVEIDAAVYECDTGVEWRANFLTLRGVGGRPHLMADGCSIPGGKGIWNPTSAVSNIIIDNIEFSGASVGDNNGAGIRYDGVGYVQISNSYFHDNQDGILFTPATSTSTLTNLTISRSEFSRNGAGDGRTHNMYISGNTNAFTLKYSYSHSAIGGHLVKTRALNNYILYNRLADESDGTSSYNIDISQGGLTYIVGNFIQQNAQSPNYGIIAYSMESPPNPVQSVYIASNTIVNEETNGIALYLQDQGLTNAKLINNLIVGIPSGQVVSFATGKATLINNLLTNSPGFVDQTHRSYYLSATSPAVGAGINPGTSEDGYSLLPTFEYWHQMSEIARPLTTTPDIGAAQYIPNQVIAPVPTLQFSAGADTIDFNSPATLSWSATNAASCSASGGWSGNYSPTGSYVTGPLLANTAFMIECVGDGGKVSASVTVVVNDSPEAAALGSYSWHEMPGTMINSPDICAAKLRDSAGTLIYQDLFGTYIEDCSPKDYGAMGIYVPETHRWYLMGGGGTRGYYGNEVYALNLATQRLERVTEPAHISDTIEYAPDDLYGSKVHITGCNGILHLRSGGIVPAARGIFGTAAYHPETGQIVIGPSGVVRGIGDCGPKGQYATDIWQFDPRTTQWTLVSGDNDLLGDSSLSLFILDPNTGLIIDKVGGVGAGPAQRGGYLYDFPTRTLKMVDDVWPFHDVFGSTAVDTVHRYSLTIGNLNGVVGVYDLNGLSLSAYGITGSGKPLLKAASGWTATGDTTILSIADIAITYNPNIQQFVAWAGGEKLYFMSPDYKNRVLKIVSKSISGGPSAVGSTLTGHLEYIPDYDLYLAFVGTNSNVYYLKSDTVPVTSLPTSGASASTSTNVPSITPFALPPNLSLVGMFPY